MLCEVSPEGPFAQDLLDERFATTNLSPEDRRLTFELVLGTVRHQRTLEVIVRSRVSRPWQQVESPLQMLLLLGAYQLVFLSHIPPHAAVNETSQLTKLAGRPDWTGFVNGVLRGLSRAMTSEVLTAPAIDAVPLRPGEFLRIEGLRFPDPAAEPASYFADAFSFPDGASLRWTQRFRPEELITLGFWFNQPPAMCLRVNCLRTDREALLASWRQAGIAARPGGLDEALWLDRTSRIGRIDALPGFADGHFSVQDESAMAAARLLDPQPGERVWDICAAPGGKTTQLAERMRNAGTIIATDIESQRLARIRQSCTRLGVTSVTAQLMRTDLSDAPAGPFNAVLVDVPCSNTGVLGRRPEARWRLNPKDLAELTAIQQRLLTTALARVRPGGRLVYSTCSIEPEENEQLVRQVVAAFPAAHLAQESYHLPGQPADGAYQALIRVSL